jgi:hypothetical protein
MAEKVTIKTIIDTGKKYQDKAIINIELQDGRKGSAFDSTFMSFKPDQEIEIDVAPAKDYNGEKRYYFNLPKSDNKKGFPVKDYAFEKRKTALECAVNTSQGKHTASEILVVAETYFKFLNTK